MIPKRLWMTYKTNALPEQAFECVNSWVAKNDNWEVCFMDDVGADTFIREAFSAEFYKMYEGLPHGVVKADVWRVAVVYAYGGLYADIDTVCNQPIDSWVSDNDDLVLGVEHSGGEIVQYLFAAKQEHPALLFVLEKMLKEQRTLQNTNNKFFVQDFGQQCFSRGMLEYLGVTTNEQMRLGGTSSYYETLPTVVASNTRIYSNHKTFNDFSGEYPVGHHAASLSWTSDYNSWRRWVLKNYGHNLYNTNKTAVFSSIYAENKWGTNPKSGFGSSLTVVQPYIDYLVRIIKNNNIKTVLDYGCGDWNFSKTINWESLVCSYIGADIVPEIIEQNKKYETECIKFNVVTDTWVFPGSDLIICKDVLQHLPNSSIAVLVQCFLVNAKYVLITNDFTDTDTKDCDFGGCRPLNFSDSGFTIIDSFLWDIDCSNPAISKKQILLIKGCL